MIENIAYFASGGVIGITIMCLIFSRKEEAHKRSFDDLKKAHKRSFENLTDRAAQVSMDLDAVTKSHEWTDKEFAKTKLKLAVADNALSALSAMNTMAAARVVIAEAREKMRVAGEDKELATVSDEVPII